MTRTANMPRPTRISVHFDTPNINIPADVYAGQPRITDFNTINKDDLYGPGHVLNAVNTLSTVLYK
jgi:hypothetical protein